MIYYTLIYPGNFFEFCYNHLVDMQETGGRPPECLKQFPKIDHTHSVPKKPNLVLDGMFFRTTNLDRSMSRFVVL